MFFDGLEDLPALVAVLRVACQSERDGQGLHCFRSTGSLKKPDISENGVGAPTEVYSARPAVGNLQACQTQSEGKHR
jgi:hypothetical protein